MKTPTRMILFMTISFIALIAIVIIIGISLFNTSVDKEKTILFTPGTNTKEKITLKDLDGLPEVMKNYLIKTKIIGKPKYCNAVFLQKGEIRTNPKKDWLPFTATQYVSSKNPGFIWKSKALPMLIRDKYLNRKGEVKVSLLGLKNVALFSGKEVDQSSLGRYLGELIWFPIGFLDPDIYWETIDTKTVKAKIVKDSQTLEGFFTFDQNGMIISFKTKRYRETTLENFIGEVGEYQEYSGLLIPNKMIAIWDLNTEKMPYFRANIIDYKIM